MSISSTNTSGSVMPLVSDISFPSLCEMLVYNEDTSVDASNHFLGISVVSISLRKSVEYY